MAFNGDANGMLISNDTLWLASPSANDHPDTIVAANLSTGNILWQYKVKDTVWNFKPATPGDGTLVFQTTCGGAYRLASDGSVIWKHEAPDKFAGAGCAPSGG